MPEYARIFVIEDIARIHRAFSETLIEAAALERRAPGAAAATLRTLQRAYADFNAELDVIAKRSAVRSTQEIRHRIDSTRSRRGTGRGQPHLRSAIRSRALGRVRGLSTGAVGVADVHVLEELKNPLAPQYGSYWLAQEEGTRANIGNRRGLFFGPGYSGGGAPADPAHQGGGGPHPLFATGGQMGAVGAGTGRGLPLAKIRRPVPARHFIRDGANRSRIAWEREIRLLEARTVQRLASVIRP